MQQLKKLIDTKRAKIAIIGLGYVGLPIAMEFVKKGFFVYGLENDKRRLANLKKGISYITDISSKDIREALRKRRFLPTGNKAILGDCDVVIICVPTPLRKTKIPNISYIIQATKTAAKYLHKGQLIILESTTYPGTTSDVLLPIFRKKGLKEGKDFFLAFSPERIDPGNKRYPFSKIPKVVGGVNKISGELAAKLYSKVIKKVIPVSCTEAAEVVKLLENTFRIVNIGLINEFAMLCNRLNIDVWEVVEAAKTKPFGFMPFYPGPGIGGHCLDGNEFIFVKNGSGIETITFESFIDKLSKDPLCIKKCINGVEYIKPPYNYKMLTFDIDTKESVFKAISLFSKRKTNSKVLEITTNDNRNITVTDKHPMFVLQEGKLKIKFAGDLHVGDKMPFAILPEDGDKRNANSYESKGITISNIKNIEKVKGGFVYSAEVEDTHTIVTSYGAIVHNCIPKDPLYLSWKARKVGFKTRMIDLASHINIFMPHHVVHRAEVMFKKKDIDIAKAKILVLGVTYKKDVKDLRESPALEIIELLQNKKAKTCYSDPYIPYLDIDGIHLKGVKVTAGSIKAYDLLILATDHSGFNYKMLAKSAKLILDTRNAFGRRGIRGKNIVKL